MSKNDRVPNDKIIKEFMDLIVEAINYEDLAKRIVQMFAQILDAELCTLWREVQENGEDKLILSASYGFERRPGEEIPTYPLKWNAKSNEEIGGVTAWIAIRNEACIANSYEDLAENRQKPWYGAHHGKWDNLQFMGGAARRSFKSLLGLPVVYGNRVIGVIKAENNRSPNGFQPEDLVLATRLAPFAGIALQSMTKREQHEQNRQRVLKELTSALPVLGLTAFYQQVVDKTAELLNADICSLWLVNNDRTNLVLAANYGVRGKQNAPEYSLNWTASDDSEIDGLTPWVAIRKTPFFAGKFEDLKRHKAHRGKWNPAQWEGRPEERFGALYAVPLMRADEAIGVLKIENSQGRHVFDDVDKATFDVMADFISLAIELSSRLRSNIVFDFFHLLKQPTVNAVNVFKYLREEVSKKRPRRARILDGLEMLAINLDSIRMWTNQVLGLAPRPGKQTWGEIPSPTDLLTIFTAMIGEIKKLFPDFECHLSSQLREAVIPLTELERKKVEVIIFNILNNSYKYTGDDKEIRAEAAFEPEKITISIIDNGQGIAADILPRIFEPFFSTSDSTSKYPESLGIGLSTVKNLLDELNWTCEVQSMPGQGTSFSIAIPTTERSQE